MRRLIVFATLLLSAASPLSAGDLTYVYAREGAGTRVTLTYGNLEDVLKLQKQLKGTYIWAREGGREYVIRDAAVLDSVEKAMAPMRALEPQLESMRRRLQPVERRVDRLERELDALTDRDEDEGDGPLTATERARVRELQRALHDLEDDLQRLEEEEQRLDDREEALDEQIDKEIERLIRRAIARGASERIR